jgi:hypothetical protein
MINPQWGFNPMNKIIIRMLFAVTLFQHYSYIEDITCLGRNGACFCISCSFYINRPCHNVIKTKKYNIINFIILENIGCGKRLYHPVFHHDFRNM